MHPTPEELQAIGSLSEQKLLRIVTENARVGLVILDPDRRYVYANSTYSEMLGLPSRLGGQRLSDVLSDVYEGQVRRRLDRALAGERVAYELRRVIRDEERHFSVRLEPTTVDGAVAFVVVVITDITEQKRAEEERLFQQTMLMTERELTLDAILVVDEHGKVLSYNRRFAKMWEIPPDVVATRVDATLLQSVRDLAKDPAGFMARVQQLYGDPKEESNDEVELKDGRVLERYSAPMRDSTGRHYGRVWYFRDVTGRRKLEQQYHQAQKMEAVGRLAGGIAHDFNNMLTLILAYCQLLMDDLGANDPMRSDIQEIFDAGEAAARLTRQLLSFSRKQIIEPKSLDVNEVIGHARGLLARVVGDNVRVTVNLGSGLPAVFADSGQVEQVLVNLAMNASDAMPDGGTLTIETARVELDEEYCRMHPSVSPGAYVALSVRDTGVGMSDEVQARLFEPFFTTKEVGKGTGLGLATLHGIVTRNRGNVEVRSEVGRGSTFIVYFPPAPEQKLPDAKSEVARPVTGESILVVEDAEGLRGLARKILLKQGYHVMVAANAVEAAQLFEQDEKIDLVLTDVIMPGRTGPDLMRDLVARRPNLKVVYMSGYAEDAISHQGVLDPGIAFLQKPFTAETLSKKIREVLNPGSARAR